MAKKTNKESRRIDFKTWVWVGLAIVALILVVVLIVNFSQNEEYDSSYFHDAEGRIVLTMDQDTAALDDSIYEPNITHIVYYYDGDNITSVKAFYEYATEKEAKTAYGHLGLSDFADSKKLSGRFVVFQVKRAMFDNLTVESLKSDIETMKAIDALILDYGEGYINNYAELTFEEPDESEESDESDESYRSYELDETDESDESDE